MFIGVLEFVDVNSRHTRQQYSRWTLANLQQVYVNLNIITTLNPLKKA